MALLPVDPTGPPATGVPGGLNSGLSGDVAWVYFGRPLLFVAVVGVLMVLLRWTFTPAHDTVRSGDVEVPTAGRQADGYGLLVPVATVRTDEDAHLLRAHLVDHGIRGTVAAVPRGPGEPGAPPALAVLVFPDDLARARELLAAR